MSDESGEGGEWQGTRRSTMGKNPLFRRAHTGKQRTSTHDLPGREFVYGRKVEKGDTVNTCMTWSAEPPVAGVQPRSVAVPSDKDPRFSYGKTSADSLHVPDVIANRGQYAFLKENKEKEEALKRAREAEKKMSKLPGKTTRVPRSQILRDQMRQLTPEKKPFKLSRFSNVASRTDHGATMEGSPGGAGSPADRRISRMLYCYSCGRQYTYASLGRHIDQCPEERKNEMKMLPAALRPPPAVQPPLSIPGPDATREEIEDFNDAAQLAFRNAMPQCPNCSRRFEPDALLVHKKGCDRSHGGGAPSPAKPTGGVSPSPAKPSAAKKPAAGRVHRMIVCYCCGMEYGYASVQRHMSQCPTQRANDMKMLPPEMRPALPSAPSVPVPGADSTQDEVDSYNATASQIFRASMPQCASCGRRFEPDRLLVHARSCGKAREAEFEDMVEV